MPMVIDRIPSQDIRPGVNELLRRYHAGWYPCFTGEGPTGAIGWRKYSHRGIQWLDKIHIGKKQRHDVFDPRFEIDFNQSFEQILNGCADTSRQGATWITPHLFDVFLQLHSLGHAHSFECRQDGKVVGGAFGLQMGGIMTIESMYHTIDNASKAAYVRTCLHLRERGFKLVDVNHANAFFERFGAETVPQWRFEEILRDLRKISPSLSDEYPAPELPLSVRLQLPLTRLVHAVERRLKKAS